MPSLPRRAPALLRRVNNKPHATQDDHEADSLPTPPASNNTSKNGAAAKMAVLKKDEDIFADPKSSSDEDEAPKLPTVNKNVIFKPAKQLDTAIRPVSRPPTFKVPAGISPGSTGSKRSVSNEHDEPSSDDKMIFSSQPTRLSSNKRARLAARNIHAPVTKASQTYGSVGRKRIVTSKDQKAKQSRTSDFKVAKGLDIVPPKPQGPTFRTAKGVDMFEFGQPERSNSSFHEARGGVPDSPDSPELSELSELDSEVEEVDPRTLNLPIPKEYVPTVVCEGCYKSVPLLLKQEFEDRYNSGKAFDYKRWAWFCGYHKKEDARQVWRDRGYPDIKWESFERRLRGQYDRIMAVLEKRTSSVYRQRLQKLVDSGSTRSARAAFNTGNSEDGDLEIKPGYYGAKGEKLMTEHILRHFADDLRDLAVSDSLIGASGVAGGVSGFVQAVLVPEVAVALVKDDMGVGETRAREILKESLELGELLNEEAQEVVESEAEDDE
jgi:hypothetical protein